MLRYSGRWDEMLEITRQSLRIMTAVDTLTCYLPREISRLVLCQWPNTPYVTDCLPKNLFVQCCVILLALKANYVMFVIF